MKIKGFTIVAIVLAIFLWGGGMFFYQRRDTTAPEITINETELIYEDNMAEEELFLGVSAWDNKDGNLDGSIIIEKIVTDKEKETAVITYGVSDASGNVGKLNRQLTYLVRAVEEEAIPPITEVVENTVEEVVEEEAQQQAVEEEEAAEEDVPEETEAEQQQDPEEEASSEESQEEEAAEEEQQQEAEPLPRAGEAAEGTRQRADQNQERPALTFKEGRVKTAKGMDPAWVNIIGSLTDDKDDYGTLFGTLRIHGEYDRNTVGNYAVTVTVKDSDGNESAPVPITIEVQ